MLRRLTLPALTLLLAVGATACRVGTTVTVDVAEDGSGTVEVAVTLDPEAVQRLPDLDADGTSGPADLAALVRDDDLVAAGWTVDGPDEAGDGAVVLRVSRAFGTPDEAGRVLAELTGPSGALPDLQVTRTEAFGRTQLEFSGTADLSAGLEGFGDERLAAALEGEALGEDAAAIEERLGTPLADAFTLDVTAVLAGDRTTWSPGLGDAPVEMAASGSVEDWPPLVLAVVAALCLGALLVVLGVRGARAARARRPRA